jgi:hypothetical protein
MNRIEQLYLPWLLKHVADERLMRRYKKLFLKLYSTPFDTRHMKDHDGDRAMDGKSLLWRFEREEEKFVHDITGVESIELEERPCNMLEMLVALAIRIEESLAYDFRQGDRTGQWFWEMLSNLGIGYMSNDRFNEEEYRRCLNNFFNYTYDFDGKGCLFRSSTKNPFELQKLDIWYQMQAHMNDALGTIKLDF